MLHDSAAAAAALQDTFVVAVATLGELSEPARLRRWLFARARKECRRRIRTTSAIRDGETYPANQRPGADQRLGAMGQLTGAANESADATMSFRVISEPVAAANESADATISFRVISEPVAAANESADATMSFRVISKTDDLGHVNGDPGKPTLDPDLFRPRLAEAP
jgi:DNA-directed RNA polymerase specialized sigma24 family protein